MANDIDALISEFQAISTPDSISPYSLGVLLKRIAELIRDSFPAQPDLQPLQDALDDLKNAVATLSRTDTSLRSDLNALSKKVTSCDDAIADLQDDGVDYENRLKVLETTTTPAVMTYGDNVMALITSFTPNVTMMGNTVIWAASMKRFFSRSADGKYYRGGECVGRFCDGDGVPLTDRLFRSADGNSLWFWDGEQAVSLF